MIRGTWLRPLIWLAPLLAACLAWQLGGPLTLSLADHHGRDVVRGFFPAERGDLGAFRWSQPDAELLLPARPLPGALVLRGAVAPDGTRVRLELGGRGAVDLPPSSGALVPRVYRVLWPGRGDAAGVARLRIVSEAPQQRVEARRIGLAVSEVTLRPLGGPRLPPPLLALALLAAPPLLAVCLRAAGAGPAAAAALAALVAAAAGLLAWAQPLAAQPLLLDAHAALGPAALRWWLALQLIGLAALPMTAYLLRSLPLRGAPFAKILGALLVGWICWVLSAAGARLSLATVGGALAALALAGLWALREGGRRDLWRTVRDRWRVLVAGECLLLGGLLAGLWLRWYGASGPGIGGTEKTMDLMLLQGVLAGQGAPPPDLWLAGYTVNYYYLGYVPVAALALIAGATPGEAFNLGVAATFGLTALGVAGLVASLALLDRDGAQARAGEPSHPRAAAPARPRDTTGIAAAALLGVVLVLLAGNQIGTLQILLGGSQVRALDGGQLVEALGQRLAGAQEIRLSRPTPPTPDFGVIAGWSPAAEEGFDWWGPSRAVHDDLAGPGGEVVRRHAITEFPFFGFFLGDLHPHVLALPYGVLALALALATAARPAAPVFLWTWRGRLELLATGVVLGGLYAVNPWDAPGYALLYVGALALLYGRLWAEPRSEDVQAGRVPGPLSFHLRAAVPSWLTPWLQSVLAVGLAALFAAGPFLSSYRSPLGGAPGQPQPWAGVPLLELLGRGLGPAPAHTGLHTFLAIFGLFLVPLVALTAQAWGGGRLAMGLWLLVAGALAVGLLAGFPLAALLPLALLLGLGAWRGRGRPAHALALWGAAVGALAVLAADLVYVRDLLEGQMSRYNTVFKAYLQAWVIWGALAGYAAWAVLREGIRQRAQGKRALWTICCLVPFAFLLVSALVYPVESLRRGERWGPGERAIDGLAPLARARPEEAAAVAWLARNAGPGDVLLTAYCTCVPDEIGRVAAMAGVPTVIGRSEGHQRLWRAGIPADLAEIAARERDVPRIYETTDAGEARGLLARYGVRYVYVGPTERELYGAAGLAKFEAMFETAFAAGPARVYRVAGDG